MSILFTNFVSVWAEWILFCHSTFLSYNILITHETFQINKIINTGDLYFNVTYIIFYSLRENKTGRTLCVAYKRKQPIPVAARSNVKVFGRSPAEIVGSKPAGCTDVSLLWLLFVVRVLCDGLITRPEDSYRLWHVVVCDLKSSRMRRWWLCWPAVPYGTEIIKEN